MEKEVNNNKSPLAFRIFLVVFAIASIGLIAYSVGITSQGWTDIVGMTILGLAVVAIVIFIVKMSQSPTILKKFSQTTKTYKFILRIMAILSGVGFILAGILGIIGKTILLHGGKVVKGDFAVIGGVLYLLLGAALILAAMFLKVKRDKQWPAQK